MSDKIPSNIIDAEKVMAHTFAVFEDEDKVKRWLNAPNRALNQVKPIDLFNSIEGLEKVNTILGRIEEGIYS